MPWKESHVMEQRMKFIAAYLQGDWTMTDLCEQFGVSRETGYRLVRRYCSEGIDGFRNRSRAPRRHPNETPAEIVRLIVAARRKHPHWGARTLRDWLKRRHPQQVWPAPSTIGAHLNRHGLLRARRLRRRTPGGPATGGLVQEANEVWSADFKGWFRTRDGQRCDPLTISDNFSRFLLDCQVVPRLNFSHVQPVFHRAFREFGLPRAILTDNGPPFATRGVGGLSALSIWWVKLGIEPRRIQAGKPQQNGRHERMHRTLHEATVARPRANRRAQQRAFNEFRSEYNFERPHQALGQKTPADLYRSSPRAYPRPFRIEYSDDAQVRRVRTSGEIKWRGHLHFLGEALRGEPVGLVQLDDRFWRIFFGPIELATIDDYRHLLLRHPQPLSAISRGA